MIGGVLGTNADAKGKIISLFSKEKIKSNQELALVA